MKKPERSININGLQLANKLLLISGLFWALGRGGFAQQPPPPPIQQPPGCVYFISSQLTGNPLPSMATPGQLQNLLANHPQCQIIIDVPISQFQDTDLPLRIPRKTVLTGLGPQGQVTLDFSLVKPQNPANAITIGNSNDPASGQDYVVIENLALQGPGSATTVPVNGIYLAPTIGPNSPGIIYLRNLVIKNFTVGVYGSGSFSVFADNCNVSSNQTDNYQLNNASNSWRIRGGLCSFAGQGGSGYGININQSNNTVIEAVRMESNVSAAIHTVNSDGTHISFNRFEGNNVLVDTGTTATTLVSNYYSSGDLVDNSIPSTTLRFDNGLQGGKAGNAPLAGQFPSALLNNYISLGSKTIQTAPTEIFGSYLSGPNSFKTLLTLNNSTADDSTYTAANLSYGSWILETEGRPAATESNSQFRLYYRSAGSAQSKGNVVFSVGKNGQALATSLVASINNVSFSTTPIFDASLGNVQKITLTADVTNSTLTNASAGQEIHFIICQDAAGGHTFSWPANVKGAMIIGVIGSKCNAQSFTFDGTNAYATSTGVTNM